MSEGMTFRSLRAGRCRGLARQDDIAALEDIVSVGTSAGGARANAVPVWNPATGELRSGKTKAGDGFEEFNRSWRGVAPGSTPFDECLERVQFVLEPLLVLLDVGLPVDRRPAGRSFLLTVDVIGHARAAVRRRQFPRRETD